METSIIPILSLLLLLLGMLGTIIPVLPGLILSFAGLLLFKYGANGSLPTYYVWIFGVLTLLSGILEYVIPAKTNKKYGGTRWGSVGSFLGTIIGFFWIPVPFGFLIGMLLGTFFGELIHDVKDKKKAFNSAKGAFLGFFISTAFNLSIALAMFLVVAYYFKF
jgi:hypothetical protein